MEVEEEEEVGVAVVGAGPGVSPSVATARALDSPTVLKVRCLLMASKYIFIHLSQKAH